MSIKRVQVVNKYMIEAAHLKYTNQDMSTVKFHVEGVQTVVPTKPTDPRNQSSTIHFPKHMTSTTLLQRRFHVVLCYHKDSDEDSGWVVAGRIKESLGRALQEEPMIAGRMRRREEDLEIIWNDSGVRLVEAMAEMKLDDFVEMKVEGLGVCWEDVLHTNPNFSPLFYVQVTNFSCGGYSIGISCSQLLIDPFGLTTFLKKWCNIHNNIVSKANAPKIPTFYLPHHGKSYPSQLMGPNTFNNAAQTVIFKIPTKNILNSDHKNLAARCIEEAERQIGRKVAPNLSLFLKVANEDSKVEFCSRENLLKSVLKDDFDGCVRTWDELELKNVCFNEGNKPIYVSCWINSLVDQGFVMVVPFHAQTSGLQVMVTFT